MPLFLQRAACTAAEPSSVAGLSIGKPGDAAEQEADRIAAHLMSTPVLQLARRTCSCGRPAGPDGRCAECRARAMLNRLTPLPGVEDAAALVRGALRETGHPLDSVTRAEMEARFGHGFDHVRVHAGTVADRSARAVGALAYTVGRDIVFAAGEYAPGNTQGKRLLAHELTHVLQQNPQTSSVSEGGAAHPKRAVTPARVSLQAYLARAACPNVKDVRRCPVGVRCGPGNTGTCRWFGVTNGCRCQVTGPEPPPLGVPERVGTAATGALIGAGLGAVLGAIAGGLGGAGGGTLVAPGVGTIGGGAAGGVAGAKAGAWLGAAAGGLVGGAIGWLVGE